MTKKTLLALALCFTLTFAPSAKAIGILDLSGGEDSNQGESWFVPTILEYWNQIKLLNTKEIELKQEQERQFTKEEEAIQSLSKEKKSLEQSINETTDPEEKANLQEQLSEVTFKIEQTSQTLHEKTDLHFKKLETLNKEIDSINIELERLQELAISQFVDILIVISFILLLFLFRYISAKMIQRFSGMMSLQRKSALLRINKIVFNLLISISIIVVLFSQITSILPFLAILGTALAFGLRDIITSFIGWFVIGSSQGYKIGDLIEIGDNRGRVLEVHPLLTVLKQTGLRGDSGRVMTIPNKTIFDEKIINFSKMYRFIYIMLDFVLEPHSDITKAKEALQKAIEEENGKDQEEAQKNALSLQTRFGVSNSNLEPKIYIEPDTRGILLRGKFICRLDNRFLARSHITENFYKKLQQIPEVELRLVNFGNIATD